jgi:MFS family permease
LGSIFFATSIISAMSTLIAGIIAKRIGNVKAMVFTQLPSAICLALIPVPNSLAWASALLIGRASTQSMDVAPRSAFLAASVLPEERTAFMGALNVIKTSAHSLGPLITGVLAGKGLFWVAFVAAGTLKACYGVVMLVTFARDDIKSNPVEEYSSLPEDESVGEHPAVGRP